MELQLYKELFVPGGILPTGTDLWTQCHASSTRWPVNMNHAARRSTDVSVGASGLDERVLDAGARARGHSGVQWEQQAAKTVLAAEWTKRVTRRDGVDHRSGRHRRRTATRAVQLGREREEWTMR